LKKAANLLKAAFFLPCKMLLLLAGGQLGGQQVMHPAPDSRLRPPEYNGKA